MSWTTGWSQHIQYIQSNITLQSNTHVWNLRKYSRHADSLTIQTIALSIGLALSSPSPYKHADMPCSRDLGHRRARRQKIVRSFQTGEKISIHLQSTVPALSNRMLGELALSPVIVFLPGGVSCLAPRLGVTSEVFFFSCTHFVLLSREWLISPQSKPGASSQNICVSGEFLRCTWSNGSSVDR